MGVGTKCEKHERNEQWLMSCIHGGRKEGEWQLLFIVIGTVFNGNMGTHGVVDLCKTGVY